jgi:deoxyribodipyrimidine photo-lyase
MIANSRIKILRGGEPRAGRYVLYWMQQSQRAEENPALDYAIGCARGVDQGVIVGFGLTDDYPEAVARHYAFMLQGLCEVRDTLARRKIAFVVRRGAPDEVALELAREASLVVCDRGYLRHQRRWRARVADAADCPVIEVESDVVVPVEEASSKAEVAARTLRSKLHSRVGSQLAAPPRVELTRDSRRLGVTSEVALDDVETLVASLNVDHRVAPVARLRGGTAEARRRLESFLDRGLPGYASGRREPADWQCSFMSPYLHFGQISPVEIARRVSASRRGSGADREAYLEELIVRRELAVNFVFYTPDYDTWSALPAWARRTLAEHAGDARQHRYERARLEAADTHDPSWNAAMREMVHTGFMHNSMRMYWGKKILEWSESPEQGYRTALELNNRYFLDGRDPSSYANVAWCFGLHDRPWPERPIFGTVRSMTASGLERKFDMARYVAEVDRLVEAEARSGGPPARPARSAPGSITPHQPPSAAPRKRQGFSKLRGSRETRPPR